MRRLQSLRTLIRASRPLRLLEGPREKREREREKKKKEEHRHHRWFFFFDDDDRERAPSLITSTSTSSSSSHSSHSLAFSRSLSLSPSSTPPPKTPRPFQISALLVYILCGIFSESFVANFVVIIVLLMADFWTVRRSFFENFFFKFFSIFFLSLSLASAHFLSSPTSKLRNNKQKHTKQIIQTKNVAGRLLVDLRWWNEVTDTGSSNWRFETLQEGQRSINKKRLHHLMVAALRDPSRMAAAGPGRRGEAEAGLSAGGGGGPGAGRIQRRRVHEMLQEGVGAGAELRGAGDGVRADRGDGAGLRK